MKDIKLKLLKTLTLLVLPYIVIAQTGNYDRMVYTPEGENYNVKIGNYHMELPYAICIIVDDQTGFVISPEWNDSNLINRDKNRFDPALVTPGSTSADFSYCRSIMNHDGAVVQFTWGRLGDGSVGGTIISDRETKFSIELQSGWPGFHNCYTATANGFTAWGITPSGDYIPFEFKCSTYDAVYKANMSAGASMELDLKPAEEIRFVAGIGKLPDLESVHSMLEMNRIASETKHIKAEGDWGDFIGAIADNCNFYRLYSSDNNRIVHAIGRGWWIYRDNPNYIPYFVWDLFFQSMLACLEDPEGARNTIRAVLSFQTPDGFIPSYSHWNVEGDYVTMDRSMPPVGALCMWNIYQHRPDKNFLKEVYPALVKWHEWWPKGRDGNKNGLLEWGSGKEFFQGAQWETGWDDNVHYNGAEMAGSTMNTDAVDLNSLWAMDADYLSKLAGILGLEEDRKRFEKEFGEMNKRINEVLWNEDLGLYCSRLWPEVYEETGNMSDTEGGREKKYGKFLERITLMNFYPLICGAPDNERAESVMKYLYKTDKFWGEYILPTVAYDDPVWPQQEYWRGQIWPSANYLIWQGLLKYADERHKADFVRKNIDLFMKNWTNNRNCCENYTSSQGTCEDDPNYLWGALLCRIALESLVGTNGYGEPYARQNTGFSENLLIKHIPYGGKMYTISVNSGDIRIVPE